MPGQTQHTHKRMARARTHTHTQVHGTHSALTVNPMSASALDPEAWFISNNIIKWLMERRYYYISI